MVANLQPIHCFSWWPTFYVLTKRSKTSIKGLTFFEDQKGSPFQRRSSRRLVADSGGRLRVNVPRTLPGLCCLKPAQPRVSRAPLKSSSVVAHSRFPFALSSFSCRGYPQMEGFWLRPARGGAGAGLGSFSLASSSGSRQPSPPGLASNTHIAAWKGADAWGRSPASRCDAASRAGRGAELQAHAPSRGSRGKGRLPAAAWPLPAGARSCSQCSRSFLHPWPPARASPDLAALPGCQAVQDPLSPLRENLRHAGLRPSSPPQEPSVGTRGEFGRFQVPF